MDAIELKVPPLALVLSVAAAMWLTSKVIPSLALTTPWLSTGAAALASAGIVFVLAGVVAFRKVRTTVNPTNPEATSTVVVSGVYAVSRNPMYVGFLLILAGWAIFLGHAFSFLLLPVFVLHMNRFQIVPEERVLSARFGSEYIAYMQSVRRWL